MTITIHGAYLVVVLAVLLLWWAIGSGSREIRKGVAIALGLLLLGYLLGYVDGWPR